MSVSLVITVLNEAVGLGEFLESVAAQTVRPDQMVVVDGGSVDDTVGIMEKWAAHQTIDVKVIVAPGANIAVGRNMAIAAAAHGLIAVTDAGVRLDPRWLEQLLAAHGPEIDVVAGWFEPTWSTLTERAIASAITPLLVEIDPGRFLPSSRSLLITDEAWRSAGGYPEWLDYCEDLVFDFALKKAGCRFVFAPHAIARWSARSSIRGYATQYYRYARGDGKADLWTRRHAIRYAAYATAMLSAAPPIRARPGVGALILTGFVAYNARYLRRAWARRDDDLRASAVALAAVPGIVVTGDLAKMLGYPVGRRWRHMHLESQR